VPYCSGIIIIDLIATWKYDLTNFKSAQKPTHMKMAGVIADSLAGTTAMTLFSYLISDKKKKNYSEPELLAAMVHNVAPKLDKKTALSAGWALHYAIGVGMMTAFRAASKKGSVTRPLVFGIVGGLIGVAAWRAMFKKHPNPPAADRKGFYKQLVPAHVIFCLPLLWDRAKGE
jgi:hypothetical protein